VFKLLFNNILCHSKKEKKRKGLLLFYTWSLKPQGCKNCKSIGDSKNQKKDREAAREGLHPRKQRVNKEKLATWELSSSKTGTAAPLLKEKRPSKTAPHNYKGTWSREEPQPQDLLQMQQMLTKQEKKKKTGEYKIQDKQATRPVYKQKPRLPRSCIKHSLTRSHHSTQKSSQIHPRNRTKAKGAPKQT